MKITKSVESSVHPVFGQDTQELMTLRKLAKVVYKFLTKDDEEVEELEKALADVLEAQKVSKRRN